MSYYTLLPIFYTFKQNDISIDIQPQQSQPILNLSLYAYLKNLKEMISGNEKQWDALKKYTNPYEFIHTNYEPNMCVSRLKPLSRAYYKFIEMIDVFDLLPWNNDFHSGIHTFHLAEGPGGFIEALVHRRKNKNDTYYGMTLQDDTNNLVPGWKKAKQFLSKYRNVILEHGITGTGDVYSSSNLQYIYDMYKNSMDIVTGDGGFDFSVDYNNQEQNAIRLILCEILYALTLQKKGGSFVLKVFDIFTRPSIEMMFLLSGFYDEVHIYKPNTSRYGNSEKYVVCKGFKFENIDFIFPSFMKALVKMEQQHTNEPIHIASILSIPMHNVFLTRLCEINSIYGQQQIENMNTTFLLIENSVKKKEKLEQFKKQNIYKCIDWCQEHDIPYHTYVRNSGNIFMK